MTIMSQTDGFVFLIAGRIDSSFLSPAPSSISRRLQDQSGLNHIATS
jgi:hypothetical protein